MTVYTEEPIEGRPISPLIITGIAAVILLLLVLALTREGQRPLKPLRPTPTPAELTLSSQAILVTFDELNANPYAFQGQRIRVTGDYTPQPAPDCPDYKGLRIRWALINNNLQLNGRGFEDVLALVPEGTTLTVEGIWQLYEGTVGCGKGAPQRLIWYLQAERIVQPNPLPNFGPTPQEEAGPSPIEGTPTPPTGAPTATPTATLTPTATTTETPVETPTMPVSATITLLTETPTVTLISGTVTQTPVGMATTATSTPESTNPAATNTPPPQTTPGTAVPTVPSLPTSTPGPSPTPGSGYPGPGTATPTVSSYP